MLLNTGFFFFLKISFNWILFFCLAFRKLNFVRKKAFPKALIIVRAFLCFIIAALAFLHIYESKLFMLKFSWKSFFRKKKKSREMFGKSFFSDQRFRHVFEMDFKVWPLMFEKFSKNRIFFKWAFLMWSMLKAFST